MDKQSREDIFTVGDNDSSSQLSCTACDKTFQPADKAVRCPRCHAIHHLDCWVKGGGCATRGCRQTVHPSLRPPKAEGKPITRATVSPWVVVATVIVLLVGGVGIFRQIQSARMSRGATVGVMVSSLESQELWEDMVDAYNDAMPPKPAQLYYTPYGISGSSYEQKLVVLLAVRESPEILVLEKDRFDVYVANDVLIPLNDIVASLRQRGIALEDAALAPYTVDDDIFGLPRPHGDLILAITALSINPDESHDLFMFIYEYLTSHPEPDDDPQ